MFVIGLLEDQSWPQMLTRGVRDMDERIQRRAVLTVAGALAIGPVVRALGQENDSEPVTAGSRLRAQRLAWAGVRLELPAASLCIDPLLDPDVWGPALAAPLASLEVGTQTRFVLVTHLHPDHFDPKAVQQILGASGTLVCEAGVAAEAASRGFKVRGARVFEPLLLGDFTVTAVPAVDGYGASQVSWVVAGGDRRIVHCGDTLWHGLWWQIGRQLGPFDAAFLPINGARFGWRQPPAEVASVMTPEQAVAATVVLGASRLVPIHYGVTGAEGYQEEVDCAAKVVEIARRRNVSLELLRPGEWVRWGESTE